MHYDPKTSIAQARIDFGLKFDFANTTKYGRRFKVWGFDAKKVPEFVKTIAAQYDNVEVTIDVPKNPHYMSRAALQVRVFHEARHVPEINPSEYSKVVAQLRKANVEIEHLLQRLQVANEKLAKISDIAG